MTAQEQQEWEEHFNTYNRIKSRDLEQQIQELREQIDNIRLTLIHQNAIISELAERILE